MTRICYVLLLAAGLSPAVPVPAVAQIPMPQNDVGVDEKLGETVALDAVLKDEEGNDVTLGELIDKPTLLTLNYFSCAGICTPLLNGVLNMLNQIELDPGVDFQVITVSFDDRDKPEMAREKKANFLRNMKRPFLPDGWRFLTGESAATKQVADSVGFNFQQVQNPSVKEGWYDFVHPGVIIMLSPEGKVTRYLYGISFLPADVEMAVGEALRGEANPAIARMLQICFSYDPQGRGYVLNVTRLMGAAVLTLALGFVVFLVFQGRARRRSTGVSE